MAKRRKYKRDRQGRFARGGASSAAKRALSRVGGAISGHNAAAKRGRKS